MKLILVLAVLVSIDFSKASTLRRASNPDRHIAGRVFKVAFQNPSNQVKVRLKKNSLQQLPDGYYTSVEQIAFIRQGCDTVYAIAYTRAGELWTEPGDSVVCVVDSVSHWLRCTDLIMSSSGKLRRIRC